MVIPYDKMNRVHSLTAILTEAVKYKANHGAKFARPAHLLLYEKTIADDTTTVVCICAEAVHKFQPNDYTSYEAAEQGVAKLLCNVVNELWYNDLKNANTSTQRSLPPTSWPSSMLTAEGFMLLT
jgi:hypothetical protein